MGFCTLILNYVPGIANVWRFGRSAWIFTALVVISDLRTISNLSEEMKECPDRPKEIQGQID